MRRLLFLAVLLLSFTLVLSADTKGCGVLSGLESSGDSCSIGFGTGGSTMTFDNFHLVLSSLSGNGSDVPEITADNILVTLENTTHGAIIHFSPASGTSWGNISNDQIGNLILSYTVAVDRYSVVGAVAILTDQFSGVGTASQTKEIFTSGAISGRADASGNVNDMAAPRTPGVVRTYRTSTNPVFNDANFAVRDSLNYQANNTGTVAVYSFADEFDTNVPEPQTFAMLGGGLLLLGFVSRKLRRA